MTESTDHVKLANGLMELFTATEVVADGIKGHKELLESRGFSTPASEAMCVELHKRVLEKMFEG